MESIVATTLLDAVVGAHRFEGVKSMVIWLIAMDLIKPMLTYESNRVSTLKPNSSVQQLTSVTRTETAAWQLPGHFPVKRRLLWG